MSYSKVREPSTNKKMGTSQTQKSNQQQLVDQNYANGTFFMAMSTIEQIQRAAKKLGKGQKQFGMYDKYDYSKKDYTQLKNQLKTQLHLVTISISSFDKTYKGGKGFSLPENYNIDRVLNRLDQSKSFFYNNDFEMFAMCQDLQRLALKQYSQLKHQKMNFDQEKDKKEIKPGQYINATNQMQQQKQRFIKECHEQAAFRSNPNYSKNQTENYHNEVRSSKIKQHKKN